MSVRILRTDPTKISRRTIEAAWKGRAAETRTVIPDAECRGLALIVNATSLSWVYSYKPRGLDPRTGKRFATQSLTLGNPESLSPEAARTKAFELKGRAKAGLDPAAERKATIVKVAEQRSRTVDRLVAQYSEALPSRRRLRGPGLISPSFAAEEISHVRAAVAAMAGGRQADRGRRPGRCAPLARHRSRAPERGPAPL